MLFCKAKAKNVILVPNMLTFPASFYPQAKNLDISSQNCEIFAVL